LGFIYPAFEQIATHVTRTRARTMGHYSVPMVIRAPYGAGVRSPEIHSDSVEAFFTHMPGIKVVVPSNAYDAKGLLISAIEDPDPVLFLEPMRLYRGERKEVPQEKYTVDIGKGALLQEGEEVSIFTWGAMVPIAEKAADEMRENGITCDVIDLRTLYPLDKEIIATSVQKTGRAIIVDEGHGTGGVGSDITSVINDVPVPLLYIQYEYVSTVKRLKDDIQKIVDF